MFLIAATLLCCCLSAVVHAAEFSFQWEANSEPNLAGYKLYYKSGSCCAPYDGTDADQGKSPISILPTDLDDPQNPSYTIAGLADNTIHFFALTAVDTEGFESDFTTELNTMPPVVSAVNVEYTDATNAIVSWQTDEPATSRLDYGLTAAYGLYVEEADLSTLHRLVVNGLTPDSKYHFKIDATDADGFGPGTLTVDNNPSLGHTFTTMVNIVPDNSAPHVLSGPVVVWRSDTRALVQWQTDEPGSSELRYGAQSSTWAQYPSLEVDPIFREEHSVLLTGLSPGTLYYFRVGSTDLSGNDPETNGNDNNPSPEVSFSTAATPDTASPNIVAVPTVIAKTDTSATISWQTDEPSNSIVEFGTSASYSSSRRLDDFVTRHQVTLQGLSPATLYHFQVQSLDMAGNGPTLSGDATFTTEAMADMAAPQLVAAPSVVSKTDTSVTIAWDTDEPGTSEIHYDIIDNLDWEEYAYTKVSADPVSHHTLTINNLKAGTIYFFRVGTTDASGNGPLTSSLDNNPFPESSVVTLAGPDTMAPQVVSPPTIVARTRDSLILAWSTDEPASSLVQYGPTSNTWGSYPLTHTSTPLVMAHQVVITGLQPETRYFFRVAGTDAVNNGPETSLVDNNPSIEISGVTDPFPDISAPVIVMPPAVTATSDTTATVQWQTDEPANSLIQYGTASGQWGAYPSSQSLAEMTFLHTMTLTHLAGSTRYYIRVGALDAWGNGPTVSNEIDFVTQATTDQTSPVITTPPTITAVTDTTAIVVWETDEPGNSEVRFQKDEPGIPVYQWTTLPLVKIDPEMKTHHSVTLTHLEAGTRYHFMVGSTDALGNGPDPGNPDSNNPFTEDIFITDQTPDVSAPVILAPPMVTAVDNRSAIIAWETDEPATSMVKFGENDTAQAIINGTTWENLPWSQSDSRLKIVHQLTVTNLNPETTYVFRAGSSDALGNGPDLNQDATNASLMGTLTTEAGPDEIAPNITNIKVSTLTNKTALITWDSDEPANSTVAYGKVSSTWEGYSFNQTNIDTVKTHSVMLTNLQPETRYFFRVGSTDTHGNTPNPATGDANPSTEMAFTSAVGPDETAPQILDEPRVVSVTDTAVVIEWETDEPGNSQVQYQQRSNTWGSYEHIENDAGLKSSHRVVLTGLTPSAIYYFRVSATDASGNNHATSIWDRNPSFEYNFQTADADPPSIITYGNPDFPDAFPKVDHAQGFIDITFDETNMRHVLEEENYAFSPPLNWLDPGNSIQAMPSSGQVSTYRFFFTSIPSQTVITLKVAEAVVDADGYVLSPNRVTINDLDADDLPDDWEITFGLNPRNGAAADGEGRNGDFDGDGVDNYTEFLNHTDPKDFTSVPAGPYIRGVLPHDGAGLDDATRVPIDTAFAVLVNDSSAGIDLTDPNSVTLKIDDNVNLPYTVSLGHAAVRSVKLDPADADGGATACWVVYDRSQDTYGVYDFETTISIQVEGINNQGDRFGSAYAFKVETQEQNEAAQGAGPEFSPVSADDPDLSDPDHAYDKGLQVTSGPLQGAKIIYQSATQPDTLRFGPGNELPLLDVADVTPIGDPINLQPPSVFSVPVKLLMPLPEADDVSEIDIYLYDGQRWVLALDAKEVAPGGYGWIVPQSRVNHNPGDPAAIEFKVYHFSGVQAGLYTPPEVSTDEVEPTEEMATCFVDTLLNSPRTSTALVFMLVIGAGVTLFVLVKRKSLH